MPRTLNAGWLLLVGVLTGPQLAGCPDEGSRCTDEASQPVTVQYSVDPGEITPFPSDAFTVAEEGSRTGRRVSLPPEGAVVLGEGLGLLRPVEEVTGLLNERDGFSLLGPILVPVSGAVDKDSLPATPEESVAPGSSVYLLQVSADGEADGEAERVPVTVRAERYENPGNPVEHLLVVAPRLSLRSATRHVVVITRAVSDLDGRSVGPSEEYLYVSGRCEIPDAHPRAAQLAARREATAWLYSPPVSLAPEEVAVAFPFTTQSTEADLLALREQVRDPGYEYPVVDLDPTGDGTPDVFSPDDVPFAPPSVPHPEAIGVVLRGAFVAPELRRADGLISYGADGRPEIQSEATLPFVLTIPRDPASQPCPLAIISHGIGGRKEYLLYFAGYLARAGIASIGIDHVEHGEAPSVGTAFFDMTSTETTVANFLQSAANLVRLLQVVETDLGELDLSPDGLGDGQPDLDTGRLGYVGESLGSMVGLLFLSVEPSVKASVINVGGGGYTTFIRSFAAGIFEPHDLLPFELAMQWLMDPADPLHAMARLGAPSRIQVLFQEVVGDPVVPNRATEDLALSLQCPLVRPFTRPVEDLAVVDAPAHGCGLFQYDPARHGFLMAETDYPEASDAARRQLTRFLETYFETGTGLIEDPWAEAP